MKKTKFTPEEEKAVKRFNMIQFVVAAIGLVTLLCLPIKYCLIVVLLLLHNAFSYHKGKYEICVDEYEIDGYPTLGLEKLVKSWRWNIPLLGILTFILTTLSQGISLTILAVYTVVLFLSYAQSE